MLGVIINEQSIIENAIENNNMGEKQSQTINLLIKYYDIQNVTDKLQIKENIIEIMKNNDKEFNRSNWDEHISNSVRKYFSNKSKFKIESKINNIDKINITKNEVYSIEVLKDKKMMKVAFILLVYAKISNSILNKEDGWLNQKTNDIFKEAKVTLKGNEKQKLLHELYKLGYISIGNKTSIKINYIDSNIESEVGIVLEDFDGVIYSYLNYIGEKWKKCEDCNNKWFKLKSNNSKQKYCNECYKNKQLEWQKESMKKLRKK
jgi:hypothetical protein